MTPADYPVCVSVPTHMKHNHQQPHAVECGDVKFSLLSVHTILSPDWEILLGHETGVTNPQTRHPRDDFSPAVGVFMHTHIFNLQSHAQSRDTISTHSRQSRLSVLLSSLEKWKENHVSILCNLLLVTWPWESYSILCISVPFFLIWG